MTAIEQLAWSKSPLPANTSPEKVIVYCVSRMMYEFYEREELTKGEAQELKLSAMMYLETLKELAKGSNKIIKELARNTAPRADLVKRDKSELLEVIARIEGVATGLMKEYKDKIPKFLRM